MIKRQFFTLVEVMVALTIVSLITGIFAFSIRSLWREQAFLDEANLVVNQLRLAQDIMQIASGDLEVSFKKNNGKIVSEISIKNPFTRQIEQTLIPTKLELREIGSLRFEDDGGKVLEDDFVLTFFSKGFTMNHGLLRLTSKLSEKPAFVIALPGHPAPLTLEPAAQYKKPSFSHFRTSIERLTEITRQETAPESETENSK
ncbi:MAG: type II secretion system protein [Parachlamydiaceae bacterium]